MSYFNKQKAMNMMQQAMGPNAIRPNFSGTYSQGYKNVGVKRKRITPNNTTTNLTNIYSSSKLSKNEKKSFDMVFTNTTSSYWLPLAANVTGTNPLLTANATGGMTVLNAIPQGTQIDQRVGNKIQISSIRIKASIIIAGTGQTFDGIRIMVVYDRNPNGAYPTISSILSDSGIVEGAMSTANTNFASSQNIAYKDRFLILRDQLLTIDPDSSNVIRYDTFIKRKLETNFKSSSNPGVIGDISTGALYLIAFNEYTSSSVSYTTLQHVSCRIRYND